MNHTPINANQVEKINAINNKILTEMALDFYRKTLNCKDLNELKELVDYLHALLDSLE